MHVLPIYMLKFASWATATRGYFVHRPWAYGKCDVITTALLRPQGGPPAVIRLRR